MQSGFFASRLAHRPPRLSIGWLGAGNGGQFGIIALGPLGWSATAGFLAQRRVESFFDKPFAGSRDRLLTDSQFRRDFFIRFIRAAQHDEQTDVVQISDLIRLFSTAIGCAESVDAFIMITRAREERAKAFSPLRTIFVGFTRPGADIHRGACVTNCDISEINNHFTRQVTTTVCVLVAGRPV